MLPIFFQVGTGFYDLSKSDLRLTSINPGKKYQNVPRDMSRDILSQDTYHVMAKMNTFLFSQIHFCVFSNDVLQISIFDQNLCGDNNSIQNN